MTVRDCKSVLVRGVPDTVKAESIITSDRSVTRELPIVEESSHAVDIPSAMQANMNIWVNFIIYIRCEKRRL